MVSRGRGTEVYHRGPAGSFSSPAIALAVAVALLAVAEHVRENPSSVDSVFAATNAVTAQIKNFLNKRAGLEIPQDYMTLAHNPKAASTKPYADPSSFYTFYLKEHSNIVSRRLHFTGTTIVTLLALSDVRILASLLVGGTAGLPPVVSPSCLLAFRLFISHEAGLAEFGTMFIAYWFTGRWSAVSARRLLGPLVVGYFFAWVGHFFFEKNRPATFIYPSFSLISDFRMWFDILRGKVDIGLWK